jgi:predicted DNA binding CopG/RHH family protein
MKTPEDEAFEELEQAQGWRKRQVASKQIMRDKRITLTISNNIEAIKKQLQEEHGIEYSYAQLVDYLINFYRKQQPTKSSWQR